MNLLFLLLVPFSAQDGAPPADEPIAPADEQQEDVHPPELEPDAGAEPHKAWKWTSANGLRYTWVLPKGYAPDAPRDLVLICHGTGLDYRWGSANYPPGEFRPDDVVISVDGPLEGPGDTRLFANSFDNIKEARVLRDFLVELRDRFAVRRVFLYGHSQGGFFVVYFAGTYPELVDGVVAHASGHWNYTQDDTGLNHIPLAFVHGTADPVVPFANSFGSREHLVEKRRFKLCRLLRLPGYSHWPSVGAASACLDWCRGMRTEDRNEALAAARAILAPQAADSVTRYAAPVAFAMAYDVLCRLEGPSPVPFQDVPRGLLREVRAEKERVNKHAALHVKKLSKQFNSPDDLRLDGKLWLGYLAAFREDFRGVDAAEEYFRKLDYDAQFARQREAAAKINQVYYEEGADGDQPRDVKPVFRTVVEQLPDAFLFEAYPVDLPRQMEDWYAQAAQWKIPRDALDQYPNFVAWRKAWEDGAKAYAEALKEWK
ncbi:MAG: alpha/beta fold hydrolase [Planctomycetota bacterium]|nr:MAG: alpha/beta fold hydrolase [Planctomycetota bacterium]